MVDNSSLTASDLKRILEQIAVPGALADAPVLHSWVVTELVEEHPETAQSSPEFMIGQAFERQLMLWSQEFPLNETYHDDWLKIFCLKWTYFRQKPRLAAYQKPTTLRKLGEALVDPEILSTLVPSREAEAGALLEAEEYRTFWYSFASGQIPPPNRASEKLGNALKAFAEQLEMRRAHKFAKSVPMLAVQASAEADPIEEHTELAPASDIPSTTVPQSVVRTSSLSRYQQILDRQYPAIVGYRPPVCSYEAKGISQEIKEPVDVQAVLNEHRTLLVTGDMGAGKTVYLTQVLVPASRSLDLVPIFIVLRDYFDAKDGVGELADFVREKVYGQRQTDRTSQEVFARELAEAVHAGKVVWLLDGYDELTPRERGLLNQELERLDRFVITTRRVRPVTQRVLEASLQMGSIHHLDAFNFVGLSHSSEARVRLENWCQKQFAAHDLLENGLLLDETAKLAADRAQSLSVTAVLERAITRQLSTRVRFQSKTSANIYLLARRALRSMALEALKPKWLVGDEPNQLKRSALTVAWRCHSSEPETIFFEVVASTGLLVEDGEYWQFATDLIRDELAAEEMLNEGFTLNGRALLPQYERPLSFWMSKLAHSGQLQGVADVLNALQNQTDDPYGARWSLIVRILAECPPAENGQLRQIRLATERRLLDLWECTSSNKMKMQINLWLAAIGSDQIPDVPTSGVEYVARDIQGAQSQIELNELLCQSGKAELADSLLHPKRIDQQAITHALIDILQSGDARLVREAAVFLTQRDLGPTVLEMLKNSGPIDRLAELAQSHPTTSHIPAQEVQRSRMAQSATLAILGRPVVLSDESLLKRIPEGVIHTLMVDLHLRVRKDGNRVTIITADGREWQRVS